MPTQLCNMVNYTKYSAKRLQKNVKSMKNLQKNPKKAEMPPKNSENHPTKRGNSPKPQRRRPASHSLPAASKGRGKPTFKKPRPEGNNPHPDQSADAPITNFSQVNYLTVTGNQDDQRVDNFLLSRLKGLPRSHLYKMIRSDEIRINGKRCKPHDRLMVGDVVRIAPVRLAIKEAPVISTDFAKGLLNRVLHEDDGLIVFNKPYGMAVHGGSGESFGVIEALREATGKKYLELIHRIDKDTSGLLLIAKKRSTLKALQNQFRDKTIHKQYLCIVDGHITADSQRIDAPLLRYTLASGERRVRVAKLGESSGGKGMGEIESAKSSVTHIKVLARFSLEGRAVSLVLAMPATGRTHQIRVHMAHIGHALLGDDKYQKDAGAMSVKRLCLHAWQLSLAPDNEAQAETEQMPARPRHYTASVPDDIADILPADALKMLGEHSSS